MKEPLVSVLLPAYNVQEYLRECLNSILAQTFTDFEVIIVNDGSTDETLSICEEFTQLDSRFRVITQQNVGVAEARNTAVCNAQGSFLAFIDPDDFVRPSYLEFLVNMQKQTNGDVIACGRTIYINEEKQYEDVRPMYANQCLSAADALRALNSYASFDMSMWAKLIRRSLFDGISFPPGKLSEDQFVCFQILDKSRKTYYFPTPLYMYRHRIGSICRDDSAVNWYPLEASGSQYTYIGKHHPELMKQAAASCFFSAVGVYNDYVLRGQHMTSHVAESIRRYTKSNLFFMLRDPDLNVKKKMQGLLFVLGKPLYNRMLLSRRSILS